MVQFAAVRDGRQIGGIGFDKKPIKRNEACNLFDLQGILERDNA